MFYKEKNDWCEIKFVHVLDAILKLNKMLCRADAFSGILTNFPRQELAKIKLNNLNKTL